MRPKAALWTCLWHCNKVCCTLRSSFALSSIFFFSVFFFCSVLVLKTSLVHDGLARGLREAVKVCCLAQRALARQALSTHTQALDRRQAHLCVLAANCDEPNYGALVRALCDEHEIKLIKVPESKQLGEWVGLCKIDEEGNARKVVGCSCCVVKDFGEDSDALHVLLEYLKNRGRE